MKIRMGFVSNSSSSSFIITVARTPHGSEDLKRLAFSKKACDYLDSLNLFCAGCLSKILWGAYEGESMDDIDVSDWSEHELHVGLFDLKWAADEGRFFDEFIQVLKDEKVDKFLYVQLSQHDNSGVRDTLKALVEGKFILSGD